MNSTASKTIAVIAALDTKGHEHAFLADRIREQGCEPLLIDLGTGGEPQVSPDHTRYDVAAANNTDLQSLIDAQDRGACVHAMAEAAAVFLLKLQQEGKIDAVISLGGGGGTSMATAAMRALPIGFPKFMVSTLASGNTAHYVGLKDIVMMPSIVDVAGLNSISTILFAQAAAAVCAMAQVDPAAQKQKPLIAASMFGNTTECIDIAQPILEQAGYEVLVFHSTGSGGKAMEALIESGAIAGVFDVTTTEWADEVTGATLSAGPTRMDAMTKSRVPSVVSPGCLDMANFGEPHTVPEAFADRTFYHHNPQVTLMRTNAEECAELGKIIAQKANANPATTSILIPTQGISVISREGQSFHDPEADTALFTAIKQHATVPVLELDTHINSPEFATAAAHALLENLAN